MWSITSTTRYTSQLTSMNEIFVFWGPCMEPVKVIRVILQHGIYGYVGYGWEGAWLHALWGCMRGTEIYIFHGFQVVRSVKIKELKEYELSLRSPPPTRETLFSFSPRPWRLFGYGPNRGVTMHHWNAPIVLGSRWCSWEPPWWTHVQY